MTDGCIGCSYHSTKGWCHLATEGAYLIHDLRIQSFDCRMSCVESINTRFEPIDNSLGTTRQSSATSCRDRCLNIPECTASVWNSVTWNCKVVTEEVQKTTSIGYISYDCTNAIRGDFFDPELHTETKEENPKGAFFYQYTQNVYTITKEKDKERNYTENDLGIVGCVLLLRYPEAPDFMVMTCGGEKSTGVNAGVVIYNVTDPEHPSYVTHWRSHNISVECQFSVNMNLRFGNFLFIGDHKGNLHVFENWTNFSKPFFSHQYYQNFFYLPHAWQYMDSWK